MGRLKAALHWFGLTAQEIASIGILGLGVFLISDAISRRVFTLQVDAIELAFGVVFVAFGAIVLLKSALTTSSPSRQTHLPKIALLAFGFGATLSGALMLVPIAAQAASLTAIEIAFNDVESSVNDIETAVARFESENWRHVVGDVVEATESVTAAVSELESAIRGGL